MSSSRRPRAGRRTRTPPGGWPAKIAGAFRASRSLRALHRQIDLVVEQDRALFDDGVAGGEAADDGDTTVAHRAGHHVTAHEVPRLVLHVDVLLRAVGH